jgi:hypothetical protein
MRLPHKSLLVFNAILFIHALTFAGAAPIKEEENVIVLTKVKLKVPKNQENIIKL